MAGTEILVVGLILAAFVTVVLRGPLRSWRASRVLLDAAQLLKMDYKPRSPVGTPALVGRRGGFGVRIETFEPTDVGISDFATRVVVKTDLPAGLWMTRFKPGVDTGPSELDVSTGDAEFDAEISIKSPSALDAVARMSHSAREAARVAIGIYGATLKDAEIRFIRPDAIDDAYELTRIADSLVAFAAALCERGRSLKEQIIHNATEDPVGGVRVHNLRLLFSSRYGDSKEAQRLAEAALHDADPYVRIVAAVALGETGLDALRRIAFNPRIAANARVEAIQAMVPWLGKNRALLEEMDAALEAAEEPLLSALVRASVAADHVPPIAVLRVRSTFADGDGRIEIVRALGKSADAAAEELLIDLLRAEDEAVASEAAMTLGEMGTRKAVAALQDRTRRLALSREVKTAAKLALAKLQARFLGQGGRLSLSDDPHRGELSVSDRGGEVGIAAEEE